MSAEFEVPLLRGCRGVRGGESNVALRDGDLLRTEGPRRPSAAELRAHTRDDRTVQQKAGRGVPVGEILASDGGRFRRRWNGEFQRHNKNRQFIRETEINSGISPRRRSADLPRAG